MSSYIRSASSLCLQAASEVLSIPLLVTECTQLAFLYHF